MTSRSNISSPVLFPINTSACSAAPIATTRSGSKRVIGSRPKNCSTFSLIIGILVDPPTSTTLFISFLAISASLNARLQARIVLSTKVWTISLKISIVNVPCQSSTSISTRSDLVSSSFAAFEVSKRSLCSFGLNERSKPVCPYNHSAME